MRQTQAIVLFLGLAWLLGVGGPVVAQYTQAAQPVQASEVKTRLSDLEQEAKDLREALHKEREATLRALALIENRMIRIETQNSFSNNLLIVIAGAFVVQFVQALWGAIMRAKPRRRGDTNDPQA